MVGMSCPPSCYDELAGVALVNQPTIMASDGSGKCWYESV